MLKIPEVAERLSIGLRTAYRLVAGGELRAVRVGSRGLRVPDGELERFIAAGGAGAPAAHTNGDTDGR